MRLSKYLLILTQLALVDSVAFAQGVVNFNNSILTEPPDRTVYMPDMTPVIGSPTSPPTFVAQLYYGADASSLQAVTTGPARFRPAGVNPPGTWIGGTRTLTGFAAGEPVILQVRVWNAVAGASWEEASAVDFFGTPHGASAFFDHNIAPAGCAGPACFLMLNFRGFTLVPEPSLVGLTLLGATAFVLFARRR